MVNEKLDILLIEDDQPQADLIQDMLSAVHNQQYSMQHVHYLAQGLEALNKRSFDCVIVDLGLPDSKGLETALMVRREAKDVPIVVLTVLDDENAALSALKLDIQDYLIKGEINSAVLSRSVRYAIQRKAVAERLAESEERLRLASEAAGIGTWHWDLVKNQMVVDDKSKELFGFTPDSHPTYDDFVNVIHPEDRERVDKAVTRAVAGKEEYAEEMRVLLPGGELRWVFSTGHAHADQHGKPVRADGINMDITVRKQGEEALRASETKFAKAFGAAPAIMIIATLKDGTIIDVNVHASETLGYRRDEVLGHSVYQMQLWENPAIQQKIIEELSNGRRIENLETRYRCKAGQCNTGLVSAEAIEVDGEPCSLMLVRDITARKQAEEELVLAKEEWERTFNAVPELVAILGIDYRILRVNAAMAERIGRKPEECIGLPCYVALHGTADPPESCPHMKAVAGSGHYIAEVQEPDSDTHYLVSYTPVFDAAGKLVAVVHVARDITERKLAEKRIEQLNAELALRAADLEAANKELEAFSYTAAHDLRQPLNVIDGYCQTIDFLCGGQINAECHGYVGQIQQGVKRMTNLLDALLDFSRMSRVHLRRATVDLSAIARGVAKDLKETDPERAATFVIAEGIEANADPALLEIVLRNLIGNAWKYTGKEQEAVIEVGRTGVDGEDVIFVRDNGAGFDMADVDKLFAPFQRLRGTESVRGFGIGLATVQRIIDRHGGKVWAEGVPGKGATFFFTLNGISRR